MIHDSLKQLRLSHGYKQSYVAHKIGLSQGFYSQVERGTKETTLYNLECFATFYGLPSVERVIEDLFAESVPEK